MNFVSPSAEELSAFRTDLILFEQTLDAKPGVAEALENALGFRAGRKHWRASSGQLYAIDLGDFGRGQASMALVYGFWPAFEPRPLGDEDIDEDLAELCLWIASICDDMDPEIMSTVLDFARAARAEGDDFRLPI